MVRTVVHAATVAEGGAVGVAETAREQPELSSAKAFLLARPFGVYTCARAVPTEDVGLRLVLWSFHLERLTRGLLSETQTHEKRVWGGDAAIEALRVATRRLVEESLQAAADETKGHAMVTALWSTSDAGVRIDVHVCPMPQVKAQISNVLINGGARANAECKHSRWIVDRIPLEQHQDSLASSTSVNLHESILSEVGEDGDRLLLEGLITNFFVLKDGRVYTASEGVLSGSTREMVFMACKALGVPVVLEAPRLSEIATWDAAFVTSAVRIVIPIARVLWQPSGDREEPLRTHTLSTDHVLLKSLQVGVCDLWGHL